MRGEKTKTPGKEFAAQVSDYVPSPRRKKSSDPNGNDPGTDTLPRKSDRPWNLLGRSDDGDFAEMRGKTGHKSDTNRAQTGHEPSTELGTNRLQTGHKRAELLDRILETAHKLDTQPDTRRNTNRAQTAHKLDTQSPFTQLVGLQRKVLFFIYRACQISRSRTTDPLALEHIAKSINIRTGSVKTTLRRLEEKGCVCRIEFKNGRGGWSKYELPNHIFAAILQLETEHKLDTNWVQTENKPDTQPDTQPDTTPPSSSSSKDLDHKLTNTGNTEVSAVLPTEWNKIDPSPLTAIRFGQHQLVQLVRLGTLTVEQVQESINAFAFDLEVNEKGREINGHALNYFMGILRKGPYAPPVNYEPPEVRQIRLYLEAKEREQKMRVDLDSRLESIEFDEWAAGLSLKERTRLVPVTDFARPGSQGHNVQLKEYFRENVWAERRETVLLTDTKEAKNE